MDIDWEREEGGAYRSSRSRSISSVCFAPHLVTLIMLQGPVELVVRAHSMEK